MNKTIVKKTALTALLMAAFMGAAMADTSGGNLTTSGNFQAWAEGTLLPFIGQIKYFLQIVAMLVGMWFVLSGILLFRKSHTAQGAQGEHVKNGGGHLIFGVFLIGLVPLVQMVQSSLMMKAGNADNNIAFSVDEGALTATSAS